MKQYKVGVIGGTGMVGQRFVTLMENHPWFQLHRHCRQRPQRRQNLWRGRGRPLGHGYPHARRRPRTWWCWTPRRTRRSWPRMVDFCLLRRGYEKGGNPGPGGSATPRLECPIVSNNSAHRWTDDVPMVVPEINPEHLEVIDAQRKRLGTKRGFIAVKSNCSLQSYVPALHPLRKYGLEQALVCTYQAISGAGKTFAALAGDGGQLHPLHRRRGGEERAGAPEALGPGGERQDRQGRKAPPSPPSASGWPARTATWPRSS